VNSQDALERTLQILKFVLEMEPAHLWMFALAQMDILEINVKFCQNHHQNFLLKFPQDHLQLCQEILQHTFTVVTEKFQMIQRFAPPKEFVFHKTLVFVLLLDILEHNVNSLVALERIPQIQVFVHQKENVHLQTIAVVMKDTLETNAKMCCVSI
jgi:hypothetical protein